MRERTFCQEIHRQLEKAHGTSEGAVAGFLKKESNLIHLQGEIRKGCSLVENMTGSKGTKIQGVILGPKIYSQEQRMSPI